MDAARVGALGNFASEPRKFTIETASANFLFIDGARPKRPPRLRAPGYSSVRARILALLETGLPTRN